ncbi:MAG: pyridoxal-dependent decarboxylase [Planctomycetota bacterium]
MQRQPSSKTAGDYPLEVDPQQLESWFVALSSRLVAHIASLGEQPAGYLGDGREVAQLIKAPMPEEGERDFESILTFLFDDVVPTSFNAAGPGYLGYIPGGGLPHTALADAFSAGVNRYVGVWAAAPGLAQIEIEVADWFCRMVGYPMSSCGILTSGGSLSNLSAIVVAREEKLGEDFADGMVYFSGEAHYCVRKSARIAGLRESSLSQVAVDGEYRMDLDDLEERIAADRARGKKPFLLVGSAGTTNTGAVDDLLRLSEIAKRENLWFHVDAAYGGFFQLTERGQSQLRGIENSDSVTLDPHKGLFTSYGTGALLVREAEHLRQAHSERSDYMPPYQETDDGPLRFDFCEYGPELSRGFRGLRVWLPFQLHGARAFREQLDEKLDLAQYAFEELSQWPDLEILAEPQLSTFAFRYHPADCAEDRLNALNEAWLSKIMSRQRVFLTSTLLQGRFAIRICVLSFRTHRDRIDECLTILKEELPDLDC